MLYQDIIDRIIDLLSSDFSGLASLCRVSRACVPAARRHLHKDLDWVFSVVFDTETERQNRSKGRSVLENVHLWKYVKGLALEVWISDTSVAYAQEFVVDWMALVARIDTIQRQACHSLSVELVQ